MARDDYFVIVYRILDYLYQCFKSGEFPDVGLFGPDALGINHSYWCNILESLDRDGYICGIVVVPHMGAPSGIKLVDLKITSKGIEYLQENSMLSKARNFLKGVKETIPGF